MSFSQALKTQEEMKKQTEASNSIIARELASKAQKLASQISNLKIIGTNNGNSAIGLDTSRLIASNRCE